MWVSQGSFGDGLVVVRYRIGAAQQGRSLAVVAEQKLGAQGAVADEVVGLKLIIDFVEQFFSLPEKPGTFF